MSIFHNPVLDSVLVFTGWFLVFYLYHGLGTTLGYHRLLTHKSLKVPNWLKYFIVSGGYLGFMGAPIPWVGIHRLHHQKSDQAGDPHTPEDGFKHALYQWMFETTEVQSNEELHAQAADLMADKVLVALGSKHDALHALRCLTSCIVFRGIILFALGFIPFLANLAATFTTFWSTQFVNVFCHMRSQGYRRHETRDLSRNVWWVGLLALGEGWHNNHHAIPKSAKHGMAWFEFDLTWYAIWLMEKLGLAKSIIRPPEFSIKNLGEKLNSIMQTKEVALEPVIAESKPYSQSIRD